jgi:hypothetical protein
VRESVGYVNTAIGWHCDPTQPGIERLWDGAKWVKERPIGLSQPGEGGASITELPSPSTVGFELPSPEVLAQMGVTPKKGSAGSKRFRFGRRHAAERSVRRESR